ncbi:MAG: RsmE family RNA methyltransferase [Kiritimatiellia bacterium]
MKAWRTLPRCFADLPELVPGRVSLSRDEARHLLRVRRVSAGDRVTVLNGQGSVGLGLLETEGRELVFVEVDEIFSVPPAAPDLTLCIGALKQSAWDEVLKHAVELGVNRIFRVQTERAVSEVKSEKEHRKQQRWRECMTEACKQSANPWLPEIRLFRGVEDALQALPPGILQYRGGLEGNPPALGERLPGKLPSALAVWIGPEGDFSPAETRRLEEAGVQSVQLGERILRAETAALALIARLRLE